MRRRLPAGLRWRLLLALRRDERGHARRRRRSSCCRRCRTGCAARAPSSLETPVGRQPAGVRRRCSRGSSARGDAARRLPLRSSSSAVERAQRPDRTRACCAWTRRRCPSDPDRAPAGLRSTTASSPRAAARARCARPLRRAATDAGHRDRRRHRARRPRRSSRRRRARRRAGRRARSSPRPRALVDQVRTRFLIAAVVGLLDRRAARDRALLDAAAPARPAARGRAADHATRARTRRCRATSAATRSATSRARWRACRRSCAARRPRGARSSRPRRTSCARR